MNKNFLLACLTLLAFGMNAQTPFEETVRRADISPAWPGCEPKLTDCTKERLGEFLKANLQMPSEAKSDEVGGTVMMEFVVEKNGNIGLVRPVQDPGKGFGREATRVLELMKEKKIKWTPAEKDGKKIAFRYTVPVSFNMAAPPKDKTTASPGSKAPEYYEVVDVMPRFAGCPADSADCTFKSILTHVKSTMKYPEEAMKNNIQGQVMTTFIVDAQGNVTRAAVEKGIGHGCDEEALRVVTLMPKFEPGLLAGKPVAVKMALPFQFQIPKKDE